jgi:hypothetical protein
MDKKQEEGKGKPNRYGWLREAMPGVAALILEKRALWGDAHVNECWRRCVVERQAGWFFAREGTIAVGTPWDQPELMNFAAWNVTATQALLVMPRPEHVKG